MGMKRSTRPTWRMARSRIKELRAAGIEACWQCGADAMTGRSLCPTCYQERKQWERERSLDGWCVRCGGGMHGDWKKFKTCRKCREKAKEQYARKKAARSNTVEVS